jgi:hypothetical protein
MIDPKRREWKRERERELYRKSMIDPKRREGRRERMRKLWSDPKNRELLNKQARERYREKKRNEFQFNLLKFVRVAEKLLKDNQGE